MSPVVAIPLGGWVDPVLAYRAVARQHPHAVLLDRSGADADRVSFVGSAADEVLVVQDAEGPDPIGRVAEALRGGLPEPADSGLLGWWGWFGYGLGAAALGVDAPRDGSPDAAFLLAAVGARFDHDRGEVALIGLPGHESAVADLADRLRPLIGAAAPEPAEPLALGWSWRHDRDRYLAMVEDCRRAIAAGDAYQLCLTNRIGVDLAAAPDPVDVHLRLRALNAVRDAGVLRIGDRTLVSASPESFLTVDRRGRARTRPIKGTRPRSADPSADRALAGELRTSEKERAENLMIVDLMRNDLTRVARVGSVEVEALLVVETYPSVHQLVSTIAADLAVDPLDAVRALFPAGSMTGAPKRAAVRLLAGLEERPRGIYAGAWGRVSADRTISLSMVIRSIVLHGATAAIGTGGGITILSDPEEEWRETELKARPLLAALGATL